MNALATRGSAPTTDHEAADRTQNAKIHQFASHLNSSDTLLWNIERDPCLRTTIVAVSLLDRSPDWRRLTERTAEACEIVPRLRQRVVDAPMHFGPPRWQFDDDFDIRYHLRRVIAPTPGDLRAVLDIAEPIAMAAFDKDRPLWEFTLVEGLTGGRAAFIQKVHHCFTDGVGAISLAELFLDDKREPARHRAAAHATHPKPTSQASAVAETLAADMRSVVKASVRGGRAIPGLAGRAVIHPLGLLNTTAREIRSIGKLLAPVSEPLSPVMRDRGLSRRLDAFDVPLDELMAAAHAADSSLNDAFLAAVAGGMRIYHERHGAPVEALRVTMPINLRHDDDPLGSNRFAPARFTLSVATVDARTRMHQLGDLARGWRKEPALPLSDAIAGVLDRLPIAVTTSIFGGMLKAIDFVATNVPGIKHRSYLAGAEVIREYAFAPPTGAAVSVALLSHVDQCCIGITMDGSAVRDPEVLTKCLRKGFDEVLAVGAKR